MIRVLEGIVKILLEQLTKSRAGGCEANVGCLPAIFRGGENPSIGVDYGRLVDS